MLAVDDSLVREYKSSSLSRLWAKRLFGACWKHHVSRRALRRHSAMIENATAATSAYSKLKVRSSPFHRRVADRFSRRKPRRRAVVNAMLGEANGISQWPAQNVVIVPMALATSAAAIFVDRFWVQSLALAIQIAGWIWYFARLQSALSG